MRWAFYFSLAALAASISATASGAVFERDWKTPGDGLLTYDDVNRREWLDLSVSRLDQFPEPRLENAIAEIAPGGLFKGFTFAKRDDVVAFAQSAGIDTSTGSFAINEAPTSQIIDLVGITFQSATTFRSLGFLDDVESVGQVGADFYINFNPVTGRGGRAGLIISSSDDLLRLSIPGLMLYRVVPEPSSVFLAMGGIYGLACIFRRRHPKRDC